MHETLKTTIPSIDLSDQQKLEQWQRYKEQIAVLPYDEYLKTNYWHDVRWVANRRDRYRCQECGFNQELHTHHNNYEFRCDEIRMIHTVETLCSKCHLKRHSL